MITNTSSDKKLNVDSDNKVTNQYDHIHSDVEYTFKPTEIKQVLEDHRYSDNSLSFDINEKIDSLAETLENIDKFKPSESRKKFYDCQPLIQDLKKDYADDNEEFEQIFNESVGRNNEIDKFKKDNNNQDRIDGK